jgi:hypothetical protein
LYLFKPPPNKEEEFTAMKVKALADVSKKWAEVTPGRSAYYEAGAGVAGADWERGASNAKGAFKAAVSAGNIDQMYAGGVKRAGASKYERKVKEVGVSRFGPGVAAAEPDYADGVGPMLDTLSGITLPARAPRGSAANLQRVGVIATALNKKRLSLRAAGA